jgi:hypothetical protein
LGLGGAARLLLEPPLLDHDPGGRGEGGRGKIRRRLRWDLEARQRARAVAGAVNKGRKVEWLQDAPAVDDDGEFWIAAFWELSTCRQIVDAGIGPIPWTAAEEWARAEGLGPPGRRLLHYFVGELDVEYVGWFAEDLERRRKKRPIDPGAAGKKPPRRGRPCAAGADPQE